MLFTLSQMFLGSTDGWKDEGNAGDDGDGAERDKVECEFSDNKIGCSAVSATFISGVLFWIAVGRHVFIYFVNIVM